MKFSMITYLLIISNVESSVFEHWGYRNEKKVVDLRKKLTHLIKIICIKNFARKFYPTTGIDCLKIALVRYSRQSTYNMI